MSICRCQQRNICVCISSTFALCIVGVLIILERTQNFDVIGKVWKAAELLRPEKDVTEYFRGSKLPSSAQKLTEQKNTSGKHVTHNVDLFSDSPVKIPSDFELDKMSVDNVEDLYWDYINTVQALCRRVIRIGKLEDGGKEVCADEPYSPRPPCLVYSFGINNAWDFDEDAARIFGCTVFCFDPSMRDKKESYMYAKDIAFYMIGLGVENEVMAKKWKMRTLEQIRRDLNHTERTIDILKMDIESSEWTTLPQMIRAGSLRTVKQMQIELHGRGTSDNLKVLRMLYADGFRIFMRDRNLACKYSKQGLPRQRTSCMEVSLIRVTF